MKLVFLGCLLVAASLSLRVFADTSASSHAPIGVMGDHLHKQGEFMFSYRYMHMDMQGSRNGSSRISSEQIVTQVSNRFSNPPVQPPFLRVVPTDMTMDMHMFGLMYAPSDRYTLMAMTRYVEKEMSHLTFMGPAGSNLLGRFTTRSSGIGDTSLSALVRLRADWHATLGVSLPTGSRDEAGQILTPINTTPSPRLPYPMQLGSGTFDGILGLTYARHQSAWDWGGQWRSVLRTGTNDERYRLGNEHRLSGWLSYSSGSALSLSGRFEYFDRGNIIGSDPLIVAPVQTADPDRQGIQRLDLKLGANWLLPGSKHRLALEVSRPIRQRLDGPQLETDLMMTIGWQWAP